MTLHSGNRQKHEGERDFHFLLEMKLGRREGGVKMWVVGVARNKHIKIFSNNPA